MSQQDGGLFLVELERLVVIGDGVIPEGSIKEVRHGGTQSNRDIHSSSSRRYQADNQLRWDGVDYEGLDPDPGHRGRVGHVQVRVQGAKSIRNGESREGSSVTEGIRGAGEALAHS